MHSSPGLFSRLKYACYFFGPILPLSHPFPQMVPYLPAIHHATVYGLSNHIKVQCDFLYELEQQQFLFLFT
eukprot:934724-Pelagomonas_calceolata.AAC.1